MTESAAKLSPMEILPWLIPPSVSTGAVNTTSVYENEESGTLIGQSESVGARGGIDFSAGAVTMTDTDLSTAGDGDRFTGGEILLGNNSILKATDRAEITTGALVLSHGITRKDEDGAYLPGTSTEESMGLYGDIAIGSGSSIENYDMDAKGSIFIGEGAKLASVTLDAVSVELNSFSMAEGEDGTRTGPHNHRSRRPGHRFHRGQFHAGRRGYLCGRRRHLHRQQY